MKLRYRVISKDGRSFIKTRNTSKKELESWKRAYNKNYADGKRAPKSQGVARIVYLPLNKKRTVKKTGFGGFRF